jgi:hypothetical protein
MARLSRRKSGIWAFDAARARAVATYARDLRRLASKGKPALEFAPASRGPEVGPRTPARSRGRLRRAQTFLRVRGIEVAFSHEGRAGTRMIRIHTRAENTVSTVSIVCDTDHDPRSSQPPPGPVGAARDDSHRPGSTAADDADGADAKAALQYR